MASDRAGIALIKKSDDASAAVEQPVERRTGIVCGPMSSPTASWNNVEAQMS